MYIYITHIWLKVDVHVHLHYMFSVGKKIGKGGFGVVYKEVFCHVPVAVKVLSDVS